MIVSLWPLSYHPHLIRNSSCSWLIFPARGPDRELETSSCIFFPPGLELREPGTTASCTHTSVGQTRCKVKCAVAFLTAATGAGPESHSSKSSRCYVPALRGLCTPCLQAVSGVIGIPRSGSPVYMWGELPAARYIIVTDAINNMRRPNNSVQTPLRCRPGPPALPVTKGLESML